jgi:predicted AAA+ superfamily ATPase
MMAYELRVVDAELRQRLAAMGAVVIEGPKACGKTQTAMQIAGSSVLLDTDVSARRALAVEPSLVLNGKAPRLLDEWQVEPQLWNLVRREVDNRRLSGQFILTGSAVPQDDAERHTGAGRFSLLRMRPMTLFETGQSTGAMSLTELMAGNVSNSGATSLTIPDIAERITMGGWPAQQSKSVRDATRAARDYLEQVQQVDVDRVAGGRRDPVKVGRLLNSLARNVATEATTIVLAADAGGSDGPLARNTVSDYLNALERLMIVENQPAWSPHLRSRAILRSKPKRHFVDPSLAAAALSAGPDRLMADLELMGFLFKSLVIRDLRVFAQPLDGRVFHYRDNNGVEVDAIVQLADGRWGAFEVKLGQAMIDGAAENLLRFEKLIDVHKSGSPVVLAVICGTGFAYRRADGVVVIPIGALGP